ncbi:hypothetical protein YC2023_075929 [Brassica napus]
MKFDFTTERFVCLPLPFHVSELEDNKAVLSVVKDEKLSVLHYDIQAWPNVMTIWFLPLQRQTMMMISDLPSDLESEMLSRVPAKSLAKLKTTCKRWYALFRDRRFIEKNKKLSKVVRESILLSNYSEETLELVVWNPCTGQKKSIKPRTCNRGEDKYFLGRYVVNNKYSSSEIQGR